jgi:hypothetical protein
MTFFYDLNKKLDSIRAKPETTHQQLNERDMSRAAKGHEKYGKEGMEALAKAGREGKALASIRNKYDKYDEGIGSMVRNVGSMVKRGAQRAMDVVAPGDEALLKKLQKDVGMPQTGKPPMPKNSMAFHKSNNVDDNAVTGKIKEEYGPLEEKPMSPKQKSFAKLAPPADKITFADKIAGAKKEVDEMLGDVAASAMKKAISGHGTAKDKGRNESWDDMLKDVDRRRGEVKAGHKVAGAKGDIEKTTTGVKHTRRYDPKTGETDAGEESGSDSQSEKRGRGRPKGSTGKIGAKGPSGTSKLMTREGHDTDIEAAMQLLKKAGYKISKGQQELDEKAVSVSQRRAAGIARAAQKGEIPKSELRGASKEMANMSKGELHKFAATKEKGLPTKKSKKEQSVEETTVTGSVSTGGDAPSGKGKSGMTFGKGIYDSLNREIENLIAESMNVSMNMSNDAHGGPTKSLTVTATDDDAEMLGKLLKMAGLSGSAGGSGCGCGSSPCSCNSAERVEENSPDWPTKEEVTGDNDDHMTLWSGGLNKPKTTVAGDGQTTVPVTAVQMREQVEENLDEQQQVIAAESQELDEELRRMREMAGLKSAMEADSDIMKSIKSTAGAAIGAGLGGLAAGPLGAAGGAALGQLAHKGVEADIKANQDSAVKEDDMEEGNKFAYNVLQAKADGKKEADLDGDGDLERVRESINSMWKAYKA